MGCPEITVICFSRNDEKYEQKRVGLSIESLLAQTCQSFEILFYDCSPVDRKFILPVDPRLRIIEMPSPINKDWRPAHIRNIGALEAKTEYIVHINTDNVFSPKFLQILLDSIKNSDKLILCARRQTNWEQFHKINNLKDALELAPKVGLHCADVCGDCQGFRRKNFLDLGGYFGKIKGGVAEKGSWEWEAYGEDSKMYELINGKGGIEWISDREGVFMLHLAHNHRKNARLHVADVYKFPKEPDMPEDCL